MDKNQEAANFPSLWIDWTGHIVSFHEEDGYERLDFPSKVENWTMPLKSAPMVSASSKRPSLPEDITYIPKI